MTTDKQALSAQQMAEALRLLDECRSALMESDRDCDYPLIERIEALAAYEAEAKPAPAVEPVAWQYQGEPTFDGTNWHETIQVTTSEQVARFKDKDCRPLYAAPAVPAQAKPAEPVGWTDADADAARLALELECLLTDRDLPMPAVSRWWESAHEALALHRQRLDAEMARPYIARTSPVHAAKPSPAAPAAPAQVPLTRDQVKALMTECGYDRAGHQERADFINGIRYAEQAHGIGAAMAGGEG
jgi:hypothetical protein